MTYEKAKDKIFPIVDSLTLDDLIGISFEISQYAQEKAKARIEEIDLKLKALRGE